MACEICHKPYVPNIEDQEDDPDSKPHVCTTCGESFSLKIQLRKHAAVHEEGGSYICRNCIKTEDAKAYNLRLGKEQQFSCDLCSATFKSKKQLNGHINDYHPEEVIASQDEKSGSEYFQSDPESDQNAEMDEWAPGAKRKKPTPKRKSTRKKATPRKVVYLAEDSDSSIVSDLQQIKSSTKKKTKQLHCKKCDKTFKYQASFDKHKCIGSNIKKERKSKEIKVKISPVKASKKSVFNEETQLYECSYCGKGFKRKSGLEGHELVHIRDKYNRDGDDDNTQDEDEEENYIPEKSRMKIHRSYACDECNYVCFSKVTLDKHMKTHDDDYEVEKSPRNKKSLGNRKKCKKCSATFASYEQMEKHLVNHMRKPDSDEDSEGDGRDLFSCTKCTRTFSSKGRLRRHMRAHDHPENRGPRNKKGKDFECDTCGKRFAGEICLKKHEFRAHNQGDGNFKRGRGPGKHDNNLIKWECDICNEEIEGKRSVFIKHRHTHTPEVCGICDERFSDRSQLREHCRIHIGTEEGNMFVECSQKHLDAKLGIVQETPKVEYIYLVVR